MDHPHITRYPRPVTEPATAMVSLALDAVTGVSHGRGITINIEKGLHAQTCTFCRSPGDLPSTRSYLARDVWDLRAILRDAGYDRSLVNQQLTDLIRQNGF